MSNRFMAICLALSMVVMIPSCMVNNNDSDNDKDVIFTLIESNGHWHGRIKNDFIDKDIVYIAATNQQTGKEYYNKIDINNSIVTKLDVYHLFDDSYTLFELFPLNDGGFYVFARSPKGEFQTLMRFDSNFEHISEIDLLDYVTPTFHEMLGVEIYNYTVCGITSDGDAVIETQREVFTISPNGEMRQKWEYVNTSGYSTIVETLVSEDSIYRLEYNMTLNKISICMLIADGSVKPYVDISSVFYTVMLDKGVFYVADDSAQILYRLCDDGEMEFLLNYNDGNASRSFHDIIALQDGGYITRISLDYYIISNNNEDKLRERVDERVTITLAAFSSSSLIKEAIYNFNQKNSNYTIEVINYGEFADGVSRLNIEIIAGTAPDLIYWGFGLSGNINPEIYSKAGVFIDLYAYIDNDEVTIVDSVLLNLLEAIEAEGGHLYEMPLSVFLMLVAGSVEVVGSKPGWTFDDYFALLEQYPEATLPFGSADWQYILSIALSNNSRTFIDWEKEEVRFDSEEFSRLLEIAKTYWDSIDTNVIEAVSIQEGKQLLSINGLSSVSSIQRFPALFGSEVNYIGFPTEQGVGNSFLLNGSISINAASDYPDVCWELVKSMLSYEIQLNRNAGFPVNLEALDYRLNNAAQFEEAAGFLYSDNEGNSWGVRLEDARPEDIVQVRSLLASCDRVFRVDRNIMTIIEEVAPSYFSGDRTLEDTVEIIQSRAQIYVSERSW